MSNELEGMRKESLAAETRQRPEGTEECHEKSQPGWPYDLMANKSRLPRT